MDSPPGDYIGGGQNHYYTTANGTFSATKNFDNGVTVTFDGSGHNWRVEVAAPGDAPLTPRTYEGAARYPFQSSNQPGLTIAGDGRGCNQSSGSFTVNEIVYGAGDAIVRFDAAFSQSCENTGPPLKGRVLFNSTSPMPPANRIISDLTAYATAGQPFNYQVKTSRPNTTFSAGNLPPGLAINTSTGLISGTPTAPGSYQVALSASGSDGTATATLDLLVDPPGRSTGLYSALEMRSEPGDFIGQGKTTSLRASDGIFTGQSFNPGQVQIAFRNQGFTETWNLTFAAPTGSNLGVGVYENAARSPSSTQPGLDVTGNGRGSNTVAGSFEVKEIAFDSNGTLKTFHAYFVQRSSGATAALTGTVWYQSPNAITSKLFVVGKEGQPFSYQIIANNQPSTYGASGLPAGLTVDPQSGVISGTPTVSGSFRVNVTATGPTTTASDYLDLTINPAQALVNVSTRLSVGTGTDVLIGGFIITGSDPKKVMVRAIGPSLAAAGVAGALSDPNLELFRSSQQIGRNDDWRTTQQGGAITQNQRPEIEATGIAPTEDVESAIVLRLEPGNYTAVMRGFGNSTGVGLIEVYDLDQGSSSRLANISTRGFVQTGEKAMIGGFIMGGNPGTGGRVVVRALGPSLAESGVSNVLADPTLELYNANGVSLRANNDWKDSQEAEIEALNLAPSKPLESAILVTLPPGGFTAIVRGRSDTVGNALVEVYNVP